MAALRIDMAGRARIGHVYSPAAREVFRLAVMRIRIVAARDEHSGERKWRYRHRGEFWIDAVEARDDARRGRRDKKSTAHFSVERRGRMCNGDRAETMRNQDDRLFGGSDGLNNLFAPVIEPWVFPIRLLNASRA